MQSSDAARIHLLELALAASRRAFGDLRERVGRLEQLVPAAPGSSPGTGGAGGIDIYKCKSPSTGTWEATGTPLATTPDSFTADVWTLVGSPALVESDATVYYDSTTTLTADAVLLVKSNGDGTYSVINWVCNAS